MRVYKNGDPIKQDNTPIKQDNTRVSTVSPQDIWLLKALRERSPYPGGATSVREIPSNEDPLWENIAEAIPFYGSFLSWDDAEEAYKQMRQRETYIPTFNEAVDMAGAIPIGGTATKVGTGLIEIAKRSPKYFQILQNLISAYDSAQDISEDNLR